MKLDRTVGNVLIVDILKFNTLLNLLNVYYDFDQLLLDNFLIDSFDKLGTNSVV